MDRFSFVMVLLSIIVGLGVTELLTNVARQIKERATIKFYWPHAFTAAIIFVALLQQWWEMWGLQSVESWSFPILFLMLAGPAGLYIISHILFPVKIAGADFKAHYLGNAVLIWSIAAVVVVIATSFRPISFGVPLLVPDNVSSLVMLILFVSLAVIRVGIFHAIVLPIIFLALVADVVMFNNVI